MDNPKVSVLTLTYNHEKYIAQALDSALEQVTDFHYEIVVSDDCSTDQTRAILINYQTRHPDRIRLLLNKHNLGMHKNAEQLFFAGKGQYLAIMEGDDYWTSPHKLQKQVTYLDQHPDCSLCFHNVTSISEQQLWEPRPHCPEHLLEKSTLEDLLLLNFIPTASVVYRKGLISEFPPWLSKLGMADWPIHLLHAQHGYLGYLNEVMGVYRCHEQGVWISLTEPQRLQSIIKMLETVNIYFDYQYEALINQSLTDFQQQLIAAAQLPLKQQLQEQEQTHQVDRIDTQTHLQHLQAELAIAQSSLDHAQNQLTQAQAQLLQTEQEKQDWRDRTQQAKARVTEVRTRLQNKRKTLQKKRKELQAAQATIAAMESSKFWKLRKVWLQLRHKLRITPRG
jgi:glycosyltransferase involved in cell wall biosynthesis